MRSSDRALETEAGASVVPMESKAMEPGALQRNVVEASSLTAVVPENPADEEACAESVQEAPGKYAHDPARLSPAVLRMLDPDAKRRHWLSINKLPGEKSADERKALMGYLVQNPVGEANYLSVEYAVRNFIMDVLREQPGGLSDAVDTFAEVYGETAQGDTMRGYALQHLASVYIDNPGTLAEADKGRVVDIFREALSENDFGTIASTALIGLREVSRVESARVTDAEVARSAQALLEDAESCAEARMTALQICGELKLPSAVGSAREWAADSSQNWGVRLAAIYLLGETQSGKTDLEQLVLDENENVRIAATAALRKWGN
uniref:HEAT repeat domain-containing protein n=1 Tax=Pontiella sp. TaxID=2837462 RepID=UPI0035647F98